MSPDLSTLTGVLKEHIESEILLRDTPLTAEEDLFAAGFDSMSLTRVMVFVEERYGIQIPDSELVVDELSTVDKLARFVHSFKATEAG
ncbi:MAG: acyl carrier protein [Polyangiaceae bacterium]